MKPRRKMIFIAVMLLLVCGLVLVGPVHHALHGHHGIGHDDARADNGGDYCDGCTLSSLESPTAFTVSGIVPSACERLDLPVLRAPSAQPLLFHSPRGPPACA
jgi:hypothetical protein